MFTWSFVVRLKGLEPPRREASDPKSDVATNYTTAAFDSCAKIVLFLRFANFFKKKIGKSPEGKMRKQAFPLP